MTISADIHLVFRALLSKNNAELGKKDVLGQPPKYVECLKNYYDAGYWNFLRRHQVDFCLDSCLIDSLQVQ